MKSKKWYQYNYCTKTYKMWKKVIFTRNLSSSPWWRRWHFLGEDIVFATEKPRKNVGKTCITMTELWLIMTDWTRTQTEPEGKNRLSTSLHRSTFLTKLRNCLVYSACIYAAQILAASYLNSLETLFSTWARTNLFGLQNGNLSTSHHFAD